MDISVTDFKTRCLELIRRVEKSGGTINIRRYGKVVARLEAATSPESQLSPWEQLRALGGQVYAAPDEPALMAEDFERRVEGRWPLTRRRASAPPRSSRA